MAENAISKITCTNIFNYLINITRLEPHIPHKEKRQTKTFRIPLKTTHLIQQIEQLDQTIKHYENNLHFLSEKYKSILPKFCETLNSTRGECK